MAAEGFLVYAVGFITPFIRDTLHVEPWLAAMPNSLMAVGLGLGGASEPPCRPVLRPADGRAPSGPVGASPAAWAHGAARSQLRPATWSTGRTRRRVHRR